MSKVTSFLRPASVLMALIVFPACEIQIPDTTVSGSLTALTGVEGSQCGGEGGHGQGQGGRPGQGNGQNGGQGQGGNSGNGYGQGGNQGRNQGQGQNSGAGAQQGQGPGQGACGGNRPPNPLENCKDDVHTYCPSLIPSEQEFDGMTEAQRKARGDEIVDCLDGYRAQLSNPCVKTIDAMPSSNSGSNSRPNS